MSGRNAGNVMIGMAILTLAMSATVDARSKKRAAPPAKTAPAAAAPAAPSPAAAGLTRQTATAEGVVSGLEPTRVQITKKDGSRWTFTVDPKTTAKDAIAVGDAVQVEFSALMRNGKPEGPAQASRITKRGKTSTAEAPVARVRETPPPAPVVEAPAPVESVEPAPDPEPLFPDTGGYDATGGSDY